MLQRRALSRASRLASWLTRPIVRSFAEDRVVGYLVFAFALTQLLAVGWDLPGSHGWENDGIAPRDLFGGIANNLTPGQGHRYPLLHYLVLGVASLPVLLAAVLSGPLSGEAIRERVLSVPCMTGISTIAKLIAIAMACLLLVTLARIVRRTYSERAGRLAVLFAATNLTFAFYGRVSNLDVPYLTWTLLALAALLDLVQRGTHKSYLTFALCAAAAVATKDQAYASFVLAAPLFLVVLPLLRPASFAPDHFRRLVIASGIGAGAYFVLSGAAFNPTGFLRRIEEMRGPASQSWRTYSKDWAGLSTNLRDVLAMGPRAFWPLPVLVLAWCSALLALVLPRRGDTFGARAGRSLPLVAGCGSLLFFTLVVARSEHRFLLPLGTFLAAYAGIGADALLTFAATLRAERVMALLLGGLLAWAGLHSFAVHLTQLGDARRTTVAWLARLPPGVVVETYGLLVYQPHFDASADAPYRVQRVGPERPRSRNPLVGAKEVEAAISDVETRRPDVLVLSEGFANSYLRRAQSAAQPLSGVVAERQRDRPTTEFVRAAVAGRLPNYRVALYAEPQLPALATWLGLRPVEIQATTGLALWLLVRDGGRAAQLRP
jgi:4-amino-4-deoxy-L-arabinose transferase-like glycosyltransferase